MRLIRVVKLMILRLKRMLTAYFCLAMPLEEDAASGRRVAYEELIKRSQTMVKKKPKLVSA